MNDLWMLKHRPPSITGYVFTDPTQEEIINNWIEAKSIPHLLFSGSPGTGKTTLAKILMNELNVQAYDIKIINASKNNKVEYIRDTVGGFIQTMPFGDFKVILLDEAHWLSPNAQAVLLEIMETYGETSRFILTTNYPHKIIPALHSRCQSFKFETLDRVEYTARVAEVLIAENVKFDLDTLDVFVKANYPDLRKCLNNCQLHSTTQKLTLPNADTIIDGANDYKLAAIELFKNREYTKARELICTQVGSAEMESFIKWTYDNLSLWGDTEEEINEAIRKIRDGAVNSSFIAEPEINVSAMIVDLVSIRKADSE